MLRDPRIVTGREAIAAGACCEGEQLREPEAAVAADARIRCLTSRVAAHERSHDRAPELLAQIEGHMREAEAMARLARGDHRLGRAAGAFRVRTGRVEP